jgi:glycosyltransferase involved in cell wall biosynthesis
MKRCRAPLSGWGEPTIPVRTAIIVKGYPRLSETFIAQEIEALEARGLDGLIVSLRRPYDPDIHPVHRRIRAPVLYLPEYLYEEPERVERARAVARTLPGYAAAYRLFRADLRRDTTTNRWRRFGQACVLAAELPDDVGQLYVHYLHTPTSVARYAAVMRGLSYAVSAHAKDIWTTPDWEIAEKLDDAAWTTTCTAVNLDRLRGLTAHPERVFLAYHGLDFSQFPEPPARAPRDGRRPDDPVRLVSVGRAVEKKGYDVLIDALAHLPPDLYCRLTHIGGGTLTSALRRRAEATGLADRIDWLGPQPRDRVIDALIAADLFVLPAKPAADGDRDGLPNVLMEAQAVGLACLATDFSAIPELITDGQTGTLVPPGDAVALADALARLIADPARRAAEGHAGAQFVRAHFDLTAGIHAIARHLGLPAPTRIGP